MITLFNKLERENLLKQGSLLDLGSGNGKISEPFLRYGYRAILVDKDANILQEAEDNLRNINNEKFRTLALSIEDFKFEDNYDGIIISNVLPFIKEKVVVSRIITSAFDKLNPGGFLYLTLFGTKDQWAHKRADSMSFFDKEEALSVLKDSPYFVSEDYGRGITLNGEMKIWHVLYLLYIK